MGKGKKKATKGRYEDGIVRLMHAARSPTRIVRMVLSVQTFYGTTAGGVMQGAIVMDPSASAEWSSCALLYDQFRVIGGQVKISSMQANSGTAGNGLIRMAYDNDSTTTPASYADVMMYSEVTDFPATWTSGSIKTFNFRRPTINGVVQSQSNWYNETTPSASPGAVKFYGQGLTGTITYWSTVTDYLVEFQMRS